MRRIISALIVISIMTGVSLADSTFDGIEDFTASAIPERGGDAIAQYNPELEITISHDFSVGGHSMGIAYDGDYYYLINGGSTSYGVILTHDLDGNFVRTVDTGLDGRAVFYNPLDQEIYVKVYGMDLYTVNPVTGAVSLVHQGIFHYSQSRVAFDANSQLMYEMVDGTVYVIELSTGNTTDTMSGFIYGSWGYNCAIATNGVHIFTWTDGGTVYAYDFSGSLEESFTIPSGSYGWSLDFTNNLLWAADDADYGPDGVWYGYSGVEGSEVDVSEDEIVPLQFNLSQNYPNPFNASTTIRFDLPEQSNVVIEIYDLLGRKVEMLTAGTQSAGPHSIIWDAKAAASGVYFYRMEAGHYTQMRRCLLLK